MIHPGDTFEADAPRADVQPGMYVAITSGPDGLQWRCLVLIDDSRFSEHSDQLTTVNAAWLLDVCTRLS